MLAVRSRKHSTILEKKIGSEKQKEEKKSSLSGFKIDEKLFKFFYIFKD